LDQINLRLGPDIPTPFQSIGYSEAAVWNELKTLRQLNDQLREEAASLQSRNEELKAYAHTVAHALKNPLAVLILIASAIGEITDLTPQELRDYKQQIKTTAFEMDDIIKDLLLLSEVDMADHLAEPLNMASVVARARKRLNHMTKEYRGHISSPKTWPVATGYAPWIEEVWVNYISNALKYGGRSPLIELGASIQPDGMVRFWVRDHGQGIPPRKQAHLFTPFTRLGQVNRPGNGLGLSIVRRIVEKLGGRAGVESQAGQGSLFFFTLPATCTCKSCLRQYRRYGWQIDQGGNLDWPSPVPAVSHRHAAGVRGTNGAPLPALAQVQVVQAPVPTPLV
jgi:signal transduction histidine kinase